jgi:hypothetical protein
LSLAIAAPWYAANLRRGNLSGMQETAAGTPIGELASAALRLPWANTVWSTAHSALWTGNNTYLAFSAVTLLAMLGLLVAAAVYYGRHVVRRGFPAAERIAAAGILLFTLGMAYGTVVFFWASHGAAWTPSPWYWQAPWGAAVVLAMLGLSDGGRSGSWVARTIVAVWTYTIVATYWAKLIPYYAGLSAGRTRLADLPGWYRQLASAAPGALAQTALLPPREVLALAVLAALGALGLAKFCYKAAN